MNYLDVYFSRTNHLGETTAERIRNSGIRSFDKWLAESPHTVSLFTERNIHFNGIVLTSKDKEYEKIMFLNVANTVDVAIGDIVNWILDNGQIEKWLVIQEERKVNGTYRTFWIIRCNYLMKWVDGNGHVQQSWSYFVSSLDSKIKGNFRTWNSLITPQPNKYAELLMPRYPINRATNFIVEEESWTVVEYDHTSVPGVIYLSLTEGKINSIYDDLEENIADTDKIAEYDLLVPDLNQVFKVGETITPVYTITKNGKPIAAEFNYISANKKIIKIVNGQITTVGEGATDIIVQLVDFPEIQQNLHIVVGSQEQEFAAYIEGPATLRLDREATYNLKATSEIIGDVEFVLQNTDLANIMENDSGSCVLRANAKNQLGTVTLMATYKGKEYQKDIQIIPLW